ncbi:MAG: hypothetical protein QOJ91_2002 [Sphingomonadales bacterium]|jgi:hypothetical protein|nr:hypothetical protein [Sphingomonadales bacterium]
MRLLSLSILVMILAGCGAGTTGSSLKTPNESTVVQMGQPLALPPADAPSYAPKPRPDVPEDCPLVVDFASYGAGVDRTAYRAVSDLLASDPAVLSVDRQPWGREGEVALCVTPRSAADAERLFHRIAAVFPADPRGPLEVRTRSGLAHRASRNP